jgi:dihydrofolate synthase/folylpolyglutamate synthase
MAFFMDEYNHIDREMNIIHVAGTNGKGSTVKIISNILMKAGYSVGMFISPQLIRYNERIQVNNNNSHSR